MGKFQVFLQKEWRENCRNFKILWIPLFFIIFGVMEPLTNYYLPEIMKSVGNLPEGMEFIWPEFTGEEIFISLLGQYQTIGILVIVLALMGSISGERKNGTATLVYVRPISFGQYYLSKWVVLGSLTIVSLFLGFLSAWYYIEMLFSHVNFMQLLEFFGVYSLWILFVVTVTLTCSATFSTGIAATISLMITLVFQVIESILGAYWSVSPWKLSMYATETLNGSLEVSNLWWSVLVTLFLIFVLMIFGIFMLKKNASKITI
ncbi:ABC transporter permease [Sporosarcina ureilytica]|uniref:ABC transporter permease n=1 Tax=Sporosarcina ureilytica TaxID=298596 RepID=A0A1D8JC08_9BACL|nr:ABC transporter permease subunit [Sporosarcina ureilytica]AOV06240.1 ABC transporter permease [Sporosarcina ureilytica]